MKTQSARGLRFYPSAVMALLAFALVTLLTTVQASNASQPLENNVNQFSRDGIEIANVPPIDAAVPSELKTATFGLG
jgi:hypothetical protein